jgi:hypothetical protein
MGEKGVWGVFFTLNREGCRGVSHREKKIGPFLAVFCVYFLRFFGTWFLLMFSNSGEGIRVFD